MFVISTMLRKLLHGDARDRQPRRRGPHSLLSARSRQH
jgi:hypothetical protein